MSENFINKFKNYNLPFDGIKLPTIQFTSNNLSNYDFLKSLCKSGFIKKRKNNIIKEDEINWYREQCLKELKLFKELEFIDYILIVWDMIDFCRKNDIPVGMGRGSAAGSVVLYLIGVTDIPVKRHGLLFERFLSLERAAVKIVNGEKYMLDLPDVDCDISRSQRYKVVEYLDKKYKGQTSKILNISTLQGKVLIKEVAKCVDNCEQSELNKITDLIPVEFGNVSDIERAYKEIPEFKEWCDKYPKSYKIALKLRGLAKNKSVHASGYLITHCNIDEFIPTELTSDKHLVSSFDMYSAGTIAVKLDLLGLKTLDILDETGKLSGKKFDSIDIDDESIYSYLRNKEAPFGGIFQAEDGLGEKTLRQIKPEKIDHIIDSIAIGRPGAMRYIENYCDVKEGKITPKIDPRVEDILRPTGNNLLYQEQLMSLCVRMAKFTSIESGGIRKAVGKKIKEKMLSYKEKFINQSIENGYDKDYVNYIWQDFENSADYSFNKCVWEEEFVNHKIKGQIKLKDIKIGDTIEAFDVKNNKDHWVKVKNIFKNKRELVWSSAGPYKIATSLDHKFLTRSSGMQSVKNCFDHSLKDDLRLFYVKTKTKYQWEQFLPAHSFFIKFGNSQNAKYNTIDLEVDHPDHNYYCNNIIVSNSHSAAYGYLTAITAYFKANYPKEFFLSLLKNAKNESEPLLEINKIQQELKYFGIELLPPCLLKGNIDFRIENNNIRFGLNCIKGIAEASLLKLNDFKPDNCNKFEMFQAANQAGLPCGVMAALIMSGALDTFVSETRSKLSFECLLFSKLKDKEKLFCIQQGHKFDFNLILMIKDILNWTDSQGKKVARSTRLNTLRKNTVKYQEIYKNNSSDEELCNLIYEKKLLGFNYSSTLKKCFSKNGRDDIINLFEFKNNVEPNQTAIVVCRLDDFKSSISRSGNNMLKLWVSDETESSYFYFSGKSYKEYLVENNNKINLEKEDIIALKLQKSKDGGGAFVQKLKRQGMKIYTKLSDLKENSESDQDSPETASKIDLSPKTMQNTTQQSQQIELKLGN